MNDTHPRPSELQALSMGRLPTVESLRVQKHLFECPACLHRLLEMEVLNELAEELNSHVPKPDRRKPLFIVHDTADGLMYSRTERRGRVWIARHWGPELEGMRVCRTMREANAFLEASFLEMFPEHRCTELCKLNPADRPTSGRVSGR